MQEAYYLKDHLGNIRVTLDGNGNVVTTDDYYPFGLQMPGRSYNMALTGSIYKYAGKEFDEESGLNCYYFGARYFDTKIGRFLSVDPFADKYPTLSPYVYTGNNPVRFIDPTGEAFYDANGKRISEKKAYSMLMGTISNYLANAKSNYKTSYNTNINFSSKAHIWYDTFGDVSYFRDNDFVPMMGKIGGHEKASAVIANLQLHDKEIASVAFKQAIDGDNNAKYSLIFSNKEKKVLVYLNAGSMNELSNILKGSGYKLKKDEKGKWQFIPTKEKEENTSSERSQFEKRWKEKGGDLIDGYSAEY